MSVFRIYLLAFFILFSLSACQKPAPRIEHQLQATDDSRIGQAIDAQFVAHWDSLPEVELLRPTDYPQAYNYLDSQLLFCLAQPQFEHAQTFNWQLRIFQAAEKEQLFVAPGGYLYFSTDFLRFLANEEELKAVLAHAMLSIDQRIISQQLQEAFSISYLLDLALGAEPDEPAQLLALVETVAYKKEEMQQLEPLFEALLCQIYSSPDSMRSFLQRVEGQNDFDWAWRFNSDFDWSAALASNNNCPLSPTMLSSNNYLYFLDQLP